MDKPGPDDLAIDDTVMRSRKGAQFHITHIGTDLHYPNGTGQPYRTVKIRSLKTGATLDTTTNHLYKVQP